MYGCMKMIAFLEWLLTTKKLKVNILKTFVGHKGFNIQDVSKKLVSAEQGTKKLFIVSFWYAIEYFRRDDISQKIIFHSKNNNTYKMC